MSYIEEAEARIGPRDLMCFLGIAGSHAYGMANENSDVDLRGVYLANSLVFLGLETVTEAIVVHDPDLTIYEMGKFLKLCLQGNPNVLELLFMDRIEENCYTWQLFAYIQKNKDKILSECLRPRYIGYARAQVAKVQRKKAGEEMFGEFGDARIAKHIRHCFRLLEQGHELLTTGSLTLKLTPDQIAEFTDIAGKDFDTISEYFDAKICRFDQAKSVLPPEPNFSWVNQALINIRYAEI